MDSVPQSSCPCCDYTLGVEPGLSLLSGTSKVSILATDHAEETLAFAAVYLGRRRGLLAWVNVVPVSFTEYSLQFWVTLSTLCISSPKGRSKNPERELGIASIGVPSGMCLQEGSAFCEQKKKKRTM